MKESSFHPKMGTYLRGVDLHSLVEKYLQGQTEHITTSIIEGEAKFISQVQAVSLKSKPKATKHEFTNESGRPFIYLGYRLQPGGKYGEISPGVRAKCMYCLKEVSSSCLGIPITKETGRHLQISYGVETIYHTIDIFCWFRCTLAELKRRQLYQNTIYSYSMTYLSEMYEATTKLPFSTLIPASDNRLLQIFNGPLEYEEWEGDLKYSSKPENIHYLPVVAYIEGTT